MRRLLGMCLSAGVISAIVANSAWQGVGISRADPPGASGSNAAKGKSGSSKQKGKNRIVTPAQAIRNEKRRLARQRAMAHDLAFYGAGDFDDAAAGWGVPVNSPAGPNGISGVNSTGFGSGSYSGNLSGSVPGSASGNASGNGLGSASGTSGDGGGSSGATGSTDAIFNSKILQFAVNQQGKEVGNGECWTLAADALLYAGAKPAQGYVFGKTVALESALPGDVVQFYSAVFGGPYYFTFLGLPHHTAVVDAVQGTKFTLLHQNLNHVRLVKMTVIDMSELRSGTVTVYRAVPKD